jgi:drug/metabolite transporter (DMT)-like permease
MLLTALIPVGVAALIFEQGRPIRWEPATILVLLYSGPLATAFANWASQSITRSLGALASAIGFLAVPVVGLASGALFLHETLGPIDLAGCGLLLVGISVGSRSAPARGSNPGREANVQSRDIVLE